MRVNEQRWVGVIVALCAVAVWLVTLTFGFVWDDFPTIVHNPAIEGWSALGNAVWGDFWAHHEIPAASGYWRPLPTVLYVLMVTIFGKSAPALHALNLFVHVGVSVVVVRWFARVGMSGAGLLVGALFFALHPIHAEPISFVSVLPDLLAAFFGLVALDLWMSQKGGRFRVVAGFLSFGLALLSKESAAVIPVIFFLVDDRPWGKRGRMFGAALGIGLLYAGAHWMVTGGIGTRPLWGGALDTHLGTVVRLVPYGLFLSFVPVGASPTRTFPISPGVGDPWVWGALALMIAIGVVGWKLRRGAPMVSRGLLLFGLFWLPVSSLIPAEGLIADRYLYLPSLGSACLVGAFIGRGTFWTKHRAIGPGVIIAAAMVWGGWAISSAWPWRSPEALWTHATVASPESSVAWNQLGKLHLEKGKWDLAAEEFQRAISIQPGHTKAELNLIRTHFRQGDLSESRRNIDRYIRMHSHDAAGWDLAATIALAQGDAKEAEKAGKKAIELAPSNWTYLYNHGLTMVEKRDFVSGISHLKKARTLAPERPQIPIVLAETYFRKGDWVNAEKTYTDILERWPDLDEAPLLRDQLSRVRAIRVLIEKDN